MTLAGIFPDYISYATYGRCPREFVLYTEEIANLGNVSPKRLDDYVLGRCCAREALAKIGVSRFPILSGRNREPLWPEGIVGSITHTRSCALSAVAFASLCLCIGVDMEANHPLPVAIKDMVLCNEEIDNIAHLSGYLHYDALIFSIKESVFKAWFPLVGTWLDFRDVSVSLDTNGQCFDVTIRRPLPAQFANQIRGATGRYTCWNGLIVSIFYVAA